MEVQINLDKWKLRQYRDYINAAKNLDLDMLLGLLATLITSWSFAGDPTDVNYYLDELNLNDWRKLIVAVNEQLSKKFDSKN